VIWSVKRKRGRALGDTGFGFDFSEVGLSARFEEGIFRSFAGISTHTYYICLKLLDFSFIHFDIAMLPGNLNAE
jgi:hypothetical protein